MGNDAATAGLPPWGQMDEESMIEIRQYPLPSDWEIDKSESFRADSWNKWFQEITEKIDVLIWPKYQPEKLNWDSAAVREMNRADFQLMDDLRHHMAASIDPNSGTTVTHAELFLEEDRDLGPGANYERYDPSLTALQVNAFRANLRSDIGRKGGSVSLQLKQVFQRPRAYQVAFMQGLMSFEHRDAYSANTPSLISGHCFQGSIGGCGAYARLSAVISAQSVRTLEQFTVDIGDRRVFAGLHYPSDNLSSWLTALKLVPHVFSEDIAASVGSFLWRAISEKSIVFSAILDHINSNSTSPYATVVKELESIGTGN